MRIPARAVGIRLGPFCFPAYNLPRPTSDKVCLIGTNYPPTIRVTPPANRLACVARLVFCLFAIEGIVMRGFFHDLTRRRPAVWAFTLIATSLVAITTLWAIPAGPKANDRQVTRVV